MIYYGTYLTIFSLGTKHRNIQFGSGSVSQDYGSVYPKPKEIFTDPQHRYLDCSVADPDPQDSYVFGPPGS